MTAGVIGATGYAGAELVRILSRHPNVDKLLLSSVSFEGEKIEDIYPNFLNKITGKLLKADDVIAASDVVFSALPHAAGEPFAAACQKKQIHFIDLSADFRFDDDEETYAAWYGKNYQFPELHKKSIYGLPEINKQRIKELAAKGAVIIGNPGCYPTGATLGILPAIGTSMAAGVSESLDTGMESIIKMNDPGGSVSPIIIDAATGTSGGGREPSRSFHYSECADSVAPYKVASHRHLPEIARNAAVIAQRAGAAAPQVIFTPHLTPVIRGILSTIYIPLSDKFCVKQNRADPKKSYLPPSKEIEEMTAKIRGIYCAFYKEEPFVRVLPEGVIASTNRVRHSNFCDISVHVDISGSTLIAVTAIDNMIKGSAGQAVQNMNILFGFEETAGLEMIPMLF